jgi:hypothetical protein
MVLNRNAGDYDCRPPLVNSVPFCRHRLVGNVLAPAIPLPFTIVCEATKHSIRDDKRHARPTHG